MSQTLAAFFFKLLRKRTTAGLATNVMASTRAL
jgi:hypothetical protein